MRLCFNISFSPLGRQRFWAFQAGLIVLSTSWAGVRRDGLALEEKGRVACLLCLREWAECVSESVINHVICESPRGGGRERLMSNTWQLFKTDQHQPGCLLYSQFPQMDMWPLGTHTHIKECYQIVVCFVTPAVSVITEQVADSTLGRLIGSRQGISHFAGVGWVTELSSLRHSD